MFGLTTSELIERMIEGQPLPDGSYLLSVRRGGRLSGLASTLVFESGLLGQATVETTVVPSVEWKCTTCDRVTYEGAS